MRRLLLMSALAVLPGAAAAQTPPPVLRNSGGDVVFVWRDSERMSEAMRMINAGVHRTNPGLIAPLVSCVAPNGSEAVVTNGGFFSSNVTVTSGRAAGCRGVVANEMISRQR